MPGPRQPTCLDCRYATPLHDGWRKLLVCANRPDAPGQLRVVTPAETCARSSRKRPPLVRLSPPEPAGDDVRYIPVTRGRFALVDTADCATLSRYKWFANGNGRGFYAARWLPNHKMLLMHRVIMDPPDGMVVDHIDGNGLNNRRANLRICSRKENSRNARGVPGRSSRFKGVHFDRRYEKWIANIRCDGKTIHIGSFDDEADAASAYDRKAAELFGLFAWLNFPEGIRRNR